MKTRKLKLLSCIMAISLATFAFAACSDGNGGSSATPGASDKGKYSSPALEGIDLEYEIENFNPTPGNTTYLEIGEMDTPTAAIWVSSGMGGSVYTTDENVVTVAKNGNVKAVGNGEAYVVIRAATGMYDILKYIVGEDEYKNVDSIIVHEEIIENSESIDVEVDMDTEAEKNTETKVPKADRSNLPVIPGIDLEYEIENFNSTNQNTTHLQIGEMDTPTAAIWVSSGTGGSVYTTDENVVTVAKNGNVKAVGNGEAYVVIRASTGMYEILKYVVGSEKDYDQCSIV